MAMRRGTGALSIAQQALDLRRRFPTASVTVAAARLVWTGTIQPTPLSRVYRVRMTYRSHWVPEVRVLDMLEERPEESLPHVYSDGTVCLHEASEWRPSMFLGDSTLAWTAEWLANYEIWQATGDWHGGGEWPPTGGRSTGRGVKDPNRPESPNRKRSTRR